MGRGGGGEVGRCGFGVDGGEGKEVSVEKERGDERQTVKQVQRKKEERDKERQPCTRCAAHPPRTGSVYAT